MKKLKHVYVLAAIGFFFSCTEDDVPDTADPNMFFGVWKLESSIVNGIAQTLTECDKESTLILYWFSEADPNYNAEIHTYEVNESGECVVVQQILNASWRPVTIFNGEGDATPQVPLNYTTEDNTIISLELGVENEFLTVQGEMSFDGEMVSITKTYRQLRQQL